MLSNPERLGQLIMESVSIRQSVQSLEGSESLADIVIGCLRRTYEELATRKKYKSSRGKASLNKAMLLLEQTVVDKIRNTIGENQPEINDQILEALNDAEEKRQIEILAARFAEQHKKITKTELDVLNYIRAHGETNARLIFDCATVPEQEWNRLIVRSRTPAGTGTGAPPSGGEPTGEIGGGDAIDMGALAIVLDKLETIMSLPNTPPVIIKSAVEDVCAEAKAASDRLEKHIDRMETEVEQHEADSNHSPENRTGARSRADLLLNISMLTLKLTQPLTVITASIEGARASSSDPTLIRDLLDMAGESATRMQQLMKRLTRLVGYPSIQQADIGIDG